MGQTEPPPRLLVFSRTTRRERAKLGLSGRRAASRSSGVKKPRGPGSGRIMSPESAAGPPAS